LDLILPQSANSKLKGGKFMREILDIFFGVTNGCDEGGELLGQYRYLSRQEGKTANNGR